ncbi:related to Plasmodium yoelii rhoptry protein [Rhynchosporium agropyri]|uniref:Related to Plasmodium yoelii rhoptry protein n=1 Tax=Rhynchosporium agropyri TaxID=914238 RepID=A0A1E1KAK4_9HELO|nr:related to Plasmodium yoelii rhoptry protein [Rhynchosporium agropyri]
MNLRGQRFEIDLSDDDEQPEIGSRIPTDAFPSISSPFVGDIKEREIAAPPSAPKMKTTPTGFPEHKKRTRISAFKQQRARSAEPAVVTDTPNAFALRQTPTNASLMIQNTSNMDGERRQIDEENRRRLAAMSAEEIEEERNELVAGLNPALLEMLLKRSNLDEGRGDTGIEPPPATTKENAKAVSETAQEDRSQEIRSKEVADSVPAPKPAGKRIDPAKSVRFEDDDNEPSSPINLQSASSAQPDPLPEGIHPSMHFPTAPTVPDLDPADPSFLENLHAKYFPNLPAEPSKLAWMAPIPTHGSIADQESPYYPSSQGLSASAFRFDFRGGLLPPRIARAVPITKGLHHHGEAPEAAGYTVPELARLARSAFPAQRCMAFQTLGRLLYRLGRGEWGGPDSEITKGLWQCVEGGKVMTTLEEAAGASGGHQGSKVYAVEAIWLWQKGGGKVMKAF